MKEKQQRIESMTRRHNEEINQLETQLTDAQQQAQAHLQLADQRHSQLTVQVTTVDSYHCICLLSELLVIVLLTPSYQ